MESPVRFLDLSGRVRIPYVEVGDGSGTPLLLLHGLTDSWRSFELVLPHLPPWIRTIAITQRGHRNAGRPLRGYGLPDFVGDLAGVMDALGIEAAVLAAHSSHTFVVERYAIDHPDRTLGLILMGAPFSLRQKPGLAGFLETVSKLSDPIDAEFVRGFARATIHRPVPQPFLDMMIEECLAVPAHVWREAFPSFLEDEHGSELERISAPTLLVWGDQDTIVTRADQDALVRAIPNASLVVYEGTGHTPHCEDPLRLARDIGAFVESLSGGAAR